MDLILRKKLLNNFFSLSSIQLISYVLPLLTIPYLVKVLGVEKFGLVAFSQATIQYFVLISDYGFGLSGTKEISQNIDNTKKIHRIFSTIITIKFLLIFLSFIILILLINSFDIFYKEKELFILTFGVVIGQALFPVWFFQGIEKMHITAIMNIIPKIFFTVCIFVFISVPDDYLFVVLINSLGFIISAIISLILIKTKFHVKYNVPTLNDIKYQIKEGWHIFLGIISSNFSILNVTFFLGLLTNPTLVGYYAAVEKIIRPIASLNRPVINAIFPHLSKIVKKDKKESFALSKKATKLAVLFMGTIGICLFIFSDLIIEIIFGENFKNSSIILKIMAFIPMIQSIIHIYGIPNMIILEYKKVYSNILFISLLLSVFLSYILILNFDYIGAALTSLFIELFILITILYYLRKLKDFQNDT